MKGMQTVIVAAAGVAAAVPGMAVLGRLSVPVSGGAFFEFALAAFSAAAVLVVYAGRERIRHLSFRGLLAIASVGMAGVLALAFVWMWLTSQVLVLHQWRNEPATQFVPLFLSDSARQLIRAAGSRHDLIMRRGPDVVLEFTTETNVAFTMIVLLLTYTALVTCLASVFAILGTAIAGTPGAPQPDSLQQP